jgi:hypothetical protein
MNCELRKRFLMPLVVIVLLTATATWLLATTTNYSQAFNTGHGWTYTQLSCTSGGTCTYGDVADGNPTPGVFAKVAVKSKVMTGYWSHAYAWTDLGVPAGDVVSTVDGQWDDKAVQTTSACTSSSTMGMTIYDGTNTALVATPEADLNVAGDTAAWTNHNPTGAVAIGGTYGPAATTITLRLDVNPASGGTTGSACELRGDNYALAIVSATPSGRKGQTIVTFNRGQRRDPGLHQPHQQDVGRAVERGNVDRDVGAIHESPVRPGSGVSDPQITQIAQIYNT